MASIEEVRSGIAQASQKASESLGALQQAHSQLEDAQRSLAQHTQGSAQGDVDEVNAQLAQAVNSIAETQQLVQTAISSAESISQRL